MSSEHFSVGYPFLDFFGPVALGWSPPPPGFPAAIPSSKKWDRIRMLFSSAGSTKNTMAQKNLTIAKVAPDFAYPEPKGFPYRTKTRRVRKKN